MLAIFRGKRVLLFLLFIFLPSCASKAWVYKEIQSDCPDFSSALLYYPSQNCLCGIEVKLLTGSFGTTCHLGLHQGGFYDTLCPVTFAIDEEQYLFQAKVLEGGQTLILPEEGIETMIARLSEGNGFTIMLEGHYEYVAAGNFLVHYPKFLSHLD